MRPADTYVYANSITIQYYTIIQAVNYSTCDFYTCGKPSRNDGCDLSAEAVRHPWSRINTHVISYRFLGYDTVQTGEQQNSEGTDRLHPHGMWQ